MNPSPFDPAPWPPWDTVAAAGLGEFYGAMVRQLERELGANGGDAHTWAIGHIQAAQQRGTITQKDATRLAALISPATDAPTAARLFEEAMDDPDSSSLAIGILSIARYKEEHASADSPHPHTDFYSGVVGGLTGGMIPFLAYELATGGMHFP